MQWLKWIYEHVAYDVLRPFLFLKWKALRHNHALRPTPRFRLRFPGLFLPKALLGEFLVPFHLPMQFKGALCIADVAVSYSGGHACLARGTVVDSLCGGAGST